MNSFEEMAGKATLPHLRNTRANQAAMAAFTDEYTEQFEGFQNEEIEKRREQLMEQLQKLENEKKRSDRRSGNTASDHQPPKPDSNLFAKKFQWPEAAGQTWGKSQEVVKEAISYILDEMRDMKANYETQLGIIRLRYENDLSSLKEKIATLETELEAKTTAVQNDEGINEKPETIQKVEKEMREKFEAIEQTLQANRTGGNEEGARGLSDQIQQIKGEVEKEVSVKLEQIIQQQRNEHIEEIKRETEREKAIIIFGVEETEIMNKDERQKSEKQRLKHIIDEIRDEEVNGESWTQDVDTIHRVGKYGRGVDRPLRVIFKSKSSAENMLQHARKLNRTQRFKEVRIKKDLNRQKREELKELINEARKSNSERTEEQKMDFFYWADSGTMRVVERRYARQGGQEGRRT